MAIFFNASAATPEDAAAAEVTISGIVSKIKTQPTNRPPTRPTAAVSFPHSIFYLAFPPLSLCHDHDL